MNDYVNILLCALFGGMGIWMLLSYFKTNKKILIKDRTWTFSRGLFLAAGIAAAVTVVFYNTFLDYLRIITMLMAIAGFLLMRDGVGEEGIVSMGKFTPWKMIRNYDCGMNKKKFTVIFNCNDKSGKSKDTYMSYIDFDVKDADKVQALLKEKIGNKYIRMKKN